MVEDSRSNSGSPKRLTDKELASMVINMESKNGKESDYSTLSMLGILSGPAEKAGWQFERPILQFCTDV